MDNESIKTSMTNSDNDDKSALIRADSKNAPTEMASKDCALSSSASNAHRSCPNLLHSMSLESLIRNFERERTNSATIKQSEAGTKVGVPMSGNLLLPTPKIGTMPLDAALMSRICKSMNNIDRIKKPVEFLVSKKSAEITEEEFFDLIERLNENRFQDQRAEFPSTGQKETTGDPVDNILHHHNAESLLAMIAEMQSRRYDDQRASPVPGDDENEAKDILRRLSLRTPNEQHVDKVADEQLYELIMSYQGTRLEDQRSELGAGGLKAESGKNSKNANAPKLQKKDSKKKADKSTKANPSKK